MSALECKTNIYDVGPSICFFVVFLKALRHEMRNIIAVTWCDVLYHVDWKVQDDRITRDTCVSCDPAIW